MFDQTGINCSSLCQSIINLFLYGRETQLGLNVRLYHMMKKVCRVYSIGLKCLICISHSGQSSDKGMGEGQEGVNGKCSIITL